MGRARNASPREYEARDGTLSWRVRFEHHGRTRSRTFGTELAAKVFCRDLNTHGPDYAVQRQDDESRRDELAGTATLDEVAEQFFAWKTSRVRSDRTVADYRRDYGNAIRPRLGSTPVGTITDHDVQQWVDDLRSGTLAPRSVGGPGGTRRRQAISAKSIGDRHALLHQIMEYAAAPSRKIIDSNPCKGTELPRKRRTQPKGLTPAEWQALDAALRQIDGDAADLATFLLASGWRWSEATALAVADVESIGERVWVTMTHVVRRTAAGTAEIVQDGKADASMRRIEVDRDVADMVRRRCVGKTPADLVFTTGSGAQWHYANFRNRYWSKAVVVANLGRKPTPHWLRHTAVVWLALSGASLPELQARIGHASIQTTIGVYGRMIQDAKPEALAAFAAMRSATPTALPTAGHQTIESDAPVRPGVRPPRSDT